MRVLFTLAISLAMASGVWAQEASPQELVKQGNVQLHAGNYDQAIDTYKQAADLLPDSPEIAYNQAIGHYRKGEFERARELFITSLKTRDPDLEASAKFNLGNCAYAAALGKRENIPEALQELESAILHYKDAIETNPEDLDARINIEMAQLLMKDLLDKQKQQEEEKQDQQDGEKEEQEQNEDQEQQEKDEEQEGEDGEQQQQDEQEQDQQQSGEQEQDQEGEDQQQGEQQQDQEGGDQQEGKQQEGQEQQSGEQSEEQQEAQAGEQNDQKGQERKMTREEAKRLLQLIRDKEMQRRREQARRARVKHAPVKKDW